MNNNEINETICTENAISACKEVHKSIVNTNEFDLYAMTRTVHYVERDAPCEFIPLAAKRAAFRLKYPEGNIVISDPVAKEGYSTVTATIYIPLTRTVEDGSLVKVSTPVASGSGYFTEPGKDCVNIYKAQDRALRYALHNAGFQGITEGSDTANEGMSSLDISRTLPGYTPNVDGYPAPTAESTAFIATPAGDKKKKGKDKKAAASDDESQKNEQEPAQNEMKSADEAPVSSVVLTTEVTSALDTFIRYHGINGTVSELLRTKRLFVEHLATQYTFHTTQNAEVPNSLSPEELEMFSACRVVIDAIEKEPALLKMLTE